MKADLVASLDTEHDLKDYDRMFRDGDMFASHRAGWRFFDCEDCGRKWRAACRDCWSGSAADCTCGSICVPVCWVFDNSQAMLDNLDEFGNLKQYLEEEISAAESPENNPVFTKATRPFCAYCGAQGDHPRRLSNGEYACRSCGEVFYLEIGSMPLFTSYRHKPHG